MSEPLIQRWDPSAVLDIITASNDISCAGITLKGLPCGYSLGGEPKRRARSLLISISQRSPREALSDLPQLARHCLCEKYHQKQASKVVSEWTAKIELYAANPGTADTRQTHQPTGHRGNSVGTYSRTRVGGDGSGVSKLCIDEIVAEMNTLAIRHEELRVMLQDVQLSEDRSPRTSPFQDAAYPVIQTPSSQLSELSERGERSGSGSSLAGQSQDRHSPSSRGSWTKRFTARGKHTK